MPLRAALAEVVDELRQIRKAIQGLRRDLKKRHDAEEAERKQAEVIVLPYPPREVGRGGR